MIPRGYLFAGGLLVLIGSNAITGWKASGWGYDKRTAEYAAARRATENKLFTAADENSRSALLFEEQSATRTVRAREFENAARADPDACLVPSPDELREIDRLWRGSERP